VRGVRGRPGMPLALALMCALLVLGGCAGEPMAIPTIGSPSPTPTPTRSIVADRSAELAREWELTGAALPSDWPDVPLPKGTQVVTAYAIGDKSRRTWTATFTNDTGTAMDIAEPVVAALRERDYVPIAEYVGAAETNTGLYSFAAPTFAVYVVLGEDDGQPNLVLTVRSSTGPSATNAPSASTSPPGSPRPAATPSR